MTHYIVTSKFNEKYDYNNTSTDFQLMCIKVRYLMLTKQYPRIKKYIKGKPYDCTAEIYNVIRNQDEYDDNNFIGLSSHQKLIAEIYKTAIKDYTYDNDESNRMGIIDWIKSNPFGLEDSFTDKVLKEIEKIV